VFAGCGGNSDSDKEVANVSSEEMLPTDKEPPVISGVKDRTVKLGETVSYRNGVEVTDNSGAAVTLNVDTSKVNLDKVGTYEVKYFATDPSGNKAEVIATVSVVPEDEISDGDVNKLADKIIAETVTDQMTDYDKALALLKWCNKNIEYAGNVTPRTLAKGAYIGFESGKGDCYVYYACYEWLLTRCGIRNMKVARVGGTSKHWWNLVNLGDGWYHCDSSRRIHGDKFYICFMQTDEQVQEYTDYYEKHHYEGKNYYVFDKTLYPERGTKTVFENEYPK
jgi:hypothetical protein